MKKLLLSVAVIATMGLASCGGAEVDAKSEAKEGVNSGPSLCECVNMVDMTEECQTMKTEWRTKFELASDEEREQMQAEIEACEAERKEDPAAAAALEAAQLEMKAALEEMNGDLDAAMEEANAELDAVME